MSESLVFPAAVFAGELHQQRHHLGFAGRQLRPGPIHRHPLIGAFSDRFGRRPVIATCVAGTVVGLGVFGLTLELPWPDGSLWPLLLLFGGRLSMASVGHSSHRRCGAG